MNYVDGFVLAVPEKNLPAYRRMSAAAGKVWRDHGALQYVEAAGDDLEVKFGVSFKKLMKLKRGETVVFSWIVFKSSMLAGDALAKTAGRSSSEGSCNRWVEVKTRRKRSKTRLASVSPRSSRI